LGFISDGRCFRGIFYSATPFPGKEFQIAMKAARRVDSSHQGDFQPGSTLLIFMNEVKSLSTTSRLDLTKNASHEIMTDSAVQRKDLSHLEGRDLQAASTEWLVRFSFSQYHLSLNLCMQPASTSTSLDNLKAEKWNQFEVNKKLFNVTSTFDESIYTTKLDPSRLSKEQIDRADRSAREIEGQTSTNIHLQEERGHRMEQELDEEDLYSGVIRETTANKHEDKEPKWRRAPQKSSSPGLGLPQSGPGAALHRSNSGEQSPDSGGSSGKSRSSGGGSGGRGQIQILKAPTRLLETTPRSRRSSGFISEEGRRQQQSWASLGHAVDKAITSADPRSRRRGCAAAWVAHASRIRAGDKKV
jgi:hypothetical protein